MVVITYYNARDDGNGEIRGIRGGQYMKDLRTEKGIIMSKNIKVTMTAIFSMCILLVAAEAGKGTKTGVTTNKKRTYESLKIVSEK